MADFTERINDLYEQAQDNNPKIGRVAFSKTCNITKSQLDGYLKGNGKNFCNTLRSIAIANHVSVSWLVGEVDERSNTNGAFKEILDRLSPEDLSIVREIAESLDLCNKGKNDE